MVSAGAVNLSSNTGGGLGNGSPHGEAYKSSKRNNPPSSLEYQYATNTAASNIANSGISKGGGFFPNLRSKPGVSGVGV